MAEPTCSPTNITEKHVQTMWKQKQHVVVQACADFTNYKIDVHVFFYTFFLPCNLNSLYQFYFGFLLYHSVNIFNFVVKMTTKMEFATCIKTLKLQQLLLFPSNGCLIMQYFMPIKIFMGEKGVMWSSSWFIYRINYCSSEKICMCVFNLFNPY